MEVLAVAETAVGELGRPRHVAERERQRRAQPVAAALAAALAAVAEREPGDDGVSAASSPIPLTSVGFACWGGPASLCIGGVGGILLRRLPRTRAAAGDVCRAPVNIVVVRLLRPVNIVVEAV